MLDLRLFKRKLVALGAATGWISFMGYGSITLMMSFYLQRILGYSPSEVGLIMIPGAFAMVVLGPPTGRLSDRYGWVKFNVAGLAISATGLFLLSTSLTTSSTLAFIIPMLVVTSSGIGLFSSPNLNSIISAVERSRYGIVNGPDAAHERVGPGHQHRRNDGYRRSDHGVEGFRAEPDRGHCRQ